MILFKREMIAAAAVVCAMSAMAAQTQAASGATQTPAADAAVQTQTTSGAVQTQAGNKQLILTVEQAVEYAGKNSRTLKSAQIDYEMKKRAGETAWNTFLPNVQATGTLSRPNEYSETYATLLNPIYEALGYGAVIPDSYSSESERWTAVGNLSASLNLSLAQIQAIRAAHASYEAGKITWQQTIAQTELNVKKMFYGLLLQQESVKLQETTLENARQRKSQAEINFKNGTIPELSLLRTQVSYENQKPVVEKSEQALQQQLDTFAFILGLPVGTKIQLQGKINPQFVTINADDLVAKYAEKNPDVLSLKKNIEMLKMQISALDLQSFTPALALSWGYQPYMSDAFDKDWMDKDNWYDNGAFSATIAWNLTNMLPFSANRQKSKDTRDSLRKLEITLETLEENTKLTVNKSVDSLAQARSSIESSERNIMLAQKAFDMSTTAYRNGTTELLDLRDAEMQLNQAKLGLVSEQYDYLSGLLDLEYTLGTKLTTPAAADGLQK